MSSMENSNPRIFESATTRLYHPGDELDSVHDYIDSREIFGELNAASGNLKWGGAKSYTPSKGAVQGDVCIEFLSKGGVRTPWIQPCCLDLWLAVLM